MNIQQFLQDLIEQLEAVDLGSEGANEELRQSLPALRDELRATLHYAQMAGVDRNLDVRSFRTFIMETSKVVRATGEAKKTLDAALEQIDVWTAGGGDLDSINEELKNLGMASDEIDEIITTVMARNREDAPERAKVVKDRIMASAGRTTEDLSESYAKMIENLQREVGAVGVQAANSILDSVISSVKQGENQNLTIGQLRSRATGYGISADELEGLRGMNDSPDELMDALRKLVEDREEKREKQVREMVGGVRGFDLRAVGYSPAEKAQEITDKALDPNDTSYTAMKALEEASARGLVSPEQVASLENASDAQIMAAVAPGLGQDQFDRARPAGGIRTALGSGIARAGGAAGVATGVLKGGIDLATPGGQSMVEAGAQAAGSFGTAAGAGIGAAIGTMAIPIPIVGTAAGAVVGGMIGGVADEAVQPYVSYVNQQREFNRMFGLSEEGVSYNPEGMLPEGLTGEVENLPEEYRNLRRAQMDVRFENPALSGNEIDGLTESLASMGLTARGTAESLDIAAELVAKSGFTMEAAAYATARGRYTEEGSEITARAVSGQRSRVAQRGVTGEQYDQMLTSGDAIRDQVGGVASFDFSQGTAETVSMFEGQNRSDFMASGGDRSINELKAALINDPPKLAQFSGNQELMHTPVYDETGAIRPEFESAVNTAMKNLVETVMVTSNFKLGAGKADVPQSGYMMIQHVLTNMNIPFSVSEILTLSEELGRNPDLFEESDRAVDEGRREAERGLQRETGQRRPGQTEREVAGNRGDMGPDGEGEGFSMREFLTENAQREAGEGIRGIMDRVQGKDPRQLREAAENLEGEQPYLAALGNIGGFDPGTLDVVGSDASLREVVRAVNSGSSRFEDEQEMLEEGSLKYRLAGGARGGKGYTGRELSEMVARGDVIRDKGGSLRMTDEARTREKEHGPDAGQTRVSADVKVTASDELSRLFNFEHSEDPQTASGRLARSEARQRRNRKGEKMSADARIY